MRINCKIPFWSDQMLASVSKYEFSKTKHFIYSSNSNSHFAIKEENGCWNSSNKNNEVCTTGTLQRAFWKQMLGKDHQREPSCPTISQPYTLSQPHSSVQRILNSAPWFYVYSSLRLVIPIFEVWYVDPLHQNLLGGTVYMPAIIVITCSLGLPMRLWTVQGQSLLPCSPLHFQPLK